MRRPLPLVVGIIACAIGLALVATTAVGLRDELSTRQHNRASYLTAHEAAYETTVQANEQILEEAQAYLDRDLRQPDELLARLTAAHRSLNRIDLPRAPGFEEESTHLADLVHDDDRFLQAVSHLVRKDPMDTPPEAADDVRSAWSSTRRLAEAASEDIGIASPPLNDQSDLVDALATHVADRGEERRQLRDEVEAREATLAPQRAELVQYGEAMRALLARHRQLQEDLEAADWGAREIRSTADEDEYDAAFNQHSRDRYDIADQMRGLSPPSDLQDLNDQIADDVYQLGQLVSDAYYAAGEVQCHADDTPVDPFFDFGSSSSSSSSSSGFSSSSSSFPTFEPEPIECMTIGESQTYIDYLAEQEPVQQDYESLRLQWLTQYEQEFRSLYDVS